MRNVMCKDIGEIGITLHIICINNFDIFSWTPEDCNQDWSLRLQSFPIAIATQIRIVILIKLQTWKLFLKLIVACFRAGSMNGGQSEASWWILCRASVRLNWSTATNMLFICQRIIRVANYLLGADQSCLNGLMVMW